MTSTASWQHLLYCPNVAVPRSLLFSTLLLCYGMRVEDQFLGIALRISYLFETPFIVSSGFPYILHRRSPSFRLFSCIREI